MTKAVKPPITARSAEEVPPKPKIRKPSKPETPRPVLAYAALYRRIIE